MKILISNYKIKIIVILKPIITHSLGPLEIPLQYNKLSGVLGI